MRPPAARSEIIMPRAWIESFALRYTGKKI